MKVSASYLDRVARDWQAAFMAANDKSAPAVVWEKGWFKIGNKKYRRAALEEMRDRLKALALTQAQPRGDVQKNDGPPNPSIKSAIPKSTS